MKYATDFEMSAAVDRSWKMMCIVNYFNARSMSQKQKIKPLKENGRAKDHH